MQFACSPRSLDGFSKWSGVGNRDGCLSGFLSFFYHSLHRVPKPIPAIFGGKVGYTGHKSLGSSLQLRVASELLLVPAEEPDQQVR